MSALLSLPLLLLLAAPQDPRPAADDKAARGADARAGSAASREPEASAANKDDAKPADKDEPPVVTKHEPRLASGRVLRYSVTTGLLPIKSDTGEVEARIFFMAYSLDRSSGP